ncbi:MAG: YfcE family phosphodiesterase [Clostridia bacterium]|nr:YfcE family phosphodiesterase [Clostridia bacterium]
MRILVFSDSHGSTYKMRTAIMNHPEADMIIHLGDGERDFTALGEEIADRKTVQVCGNCDFYSMLPDNEFINAAGKKILCTHGHSELVKHGTGALIAKARHMGAHIVLYGHTHQSVTDYDDGLYIMNPGSIQNGEYGAVDITPNGIMLLKMKL